MSELEVQRGIVRGLRDIADVLERNTELLQELVATLQHMRGTADNKRGFLRIRTVAED